MALASLENAGVVPKDKEVEIGLYGIEIAKGLAAIQERLENAIDAFVDAVGVSGSINDVHQLRCEGL